MDLIGLIIAIGQPARKCLRYHRKFNEYVEDFEQAQADLNNRKGDIHQQLQGEHCPGKKPKLEVESWFNKVEEKLDHAQRVEDKVSEGTYLFRSCLGKLLDETTQAMKKVCDEGQFSGSLVVNDSSTIAAELPTPKITGETNVIEEIYKYLMGDEVRMIGVCGMGGIGKTTIMKHVHNRLLNVGKFKKLIWATVSQDFDVRRLQNNIACQLKKKLSEDDNTTIRAAMLSEMLRKQGSYVLILDDVWCSFSLVDVGILEPTADNGCKLVLTTRSEEVVRSMGCKKVQVRRLSMVEAYQLFLSNVGQDMLPNPNLESIMKLVVHQCEGLTVPTVTIAVCMRGISDPLVWRNALDELRGYIRNINEMEEKVFRCLRFSYDRMKQKDQDCFLWGALFPKDYEINKKEIVEYWMEEGLIDEMETRQEMQDNGHSILQKLEEICLLERGDKDTYVKMHGVVRDMALHITRKRFYVKAGEQLEVLPDMNEWSEDVEKVSLMRNSISKIPQNMLSSKCQKLTTLLLSNNLLTEISESFFEHIPNLKILDLSRNPIKSLPNSISNLENLTALLLWECEKLEEVPSLSKLRALKKLHLEKTRIREVPQGMELLVHLRYLNLRFISSLDEIPHGILPKLHCLQNLAMHPKLLRAEEIRGLTNLEIFEGRFADVQDLSIYVESLHSQSRRPNKYFISVGKTVEYALYSCSKFVAFKGCNIYTEGTIILPSDVQQMGIERCNDLRSLNGISGLKEARDLRKCRIEECEWIESVFSSWCLPLQSLESLVLRHLRNLNALVADPIPCPGTFSSLKVLLLFKCKKIKMLFSTKWVLPQDLGNLEQIIVWGCDQMEEIIASEEEQGMVSSSIKFTLPNLRELGLWHLPKLKSICGANGVMVCDSLQKLEIWNCPKLKRIPLQLDLAFLDNGQTSHRLPLKYIKIKPYEWKSIEWDDPDAKKALLPLVKIM